MRLNMNNSFWLDTTKNTNYPELQENFETDICIIGGGITGAITGYLLSKQGKEVCILEKDKVCNQITANTSAKITSQHDLFYDYLITEFGFDYAQKYLYSNEDAIKLISDIINTEKIKCDFEYQDAYVFTQDDNEVEKIKRENEVVNKLGFNSEFVDKTELPIDIKGAIKFPNQAQFHPRKYVLSLLNIIENNNGKIFENSRVEAVKPSEEKFLIYTDKACVKANYLVFACHYPIINFPGFHFLKMYQDKSYVVVADTNSNLFNGMYITSKDPVLSIKTIVDTVGKRLLLVSGSGHKVGANDVEIEDSYINLENYIKSIYKDAVIKYKWSNQDCVSLDKIPYIGQYSYAWKNAYVATGYKKWGMTLSHVAGKIISDSILGIENKYAGIYDSTRLKPFKNHEEFYNMLKQTTYSLGINRLKMPDVKFEDLENDSGGVVDYKGEKLGIYKREDGKVFAIKPYCMHLGCELTWNNLEKTWDCPCHGSKYTYEGKLLIGPSKLDLKIVDINK